MHTQGVGGARLLRETQAESRSLLVQLRGLWLRNARLCLVFMSPSSLYVGLCSTGTLAIGFRGHLDNPR